MADWTLGLIEGPGRRAHLLHLVRTAPTIRLGSFTSHVSVVRLSGELLCHCSTPDYRAPSSDELARLATCARCVSFAARYDIADPHAMTLLGLPTSSGPRSDADGPQAQRAGSTAPDPGTAISLPRGGGRG